jgi:hypothetical protein
MIVLKSEVRVFFWRPDQHVGAVKRQAAPAAGTCRLNRQKRRCLFGGHRMVLSAGSKMNDSCRLGDQAAIIRHLVVEKNPCPLIFMNPTIINESCEVSTLCQALTAIISEMHF